MVNKSVKFIKPSLVIKHKNAGIKYTVRKIVFDEETKSPVVICYRYYVPNSKKKILLERGKSLIEEIPPGTVLKK